MKTVLYNSTAYPEPIIIYIGQNAKDNWNILDTSKQENELFWWFHLKTLPSSHIIVKAETLTNVLITYAAYLCKQSTKYRKYNKIAVSYTQCNNVFKDGPVGSVNFKSNKKVKNIIV